MAEVLKTELEFFEENRANFLDQHEGKFALIKGRECHGFFDTDRNAYEKGVELFGLESFLIKQVLAKDHIDQAPALMLGLVNATI